MPTFHVQPGANEALRIYAPRLGRTIRFEAGRYTTDDPAEIRVLRRNRSVYDADELEHDLTALGPPEGADPGLVNVALQKLKDDAAGLRAIEAHALGERAKAKGGDDAGAAVHHELPEHP